MAGHPQNGVESRRRHAPRAFTASRAFTLIDLLVSITVIATLIGILLPSLSMVQETSRRVVCRSNVRQIGMALAMYSDDHRGWLPPSAFRVNVAPNERASSDRPDLMMALRIVAERVGPVLATGWDGLGHLYAADYLSAGKIFYCPSHRGQHPFSRYADQFGKTQSSDLIANYHYRGTGRNGAVKLWLIEPGSSALVADGMRSMSDFSHTVGANVLRANMTADWVADVNGQIANLLRNADNGAVNTAAAVDSAWRAIDGQLANDD